MDFRDWSSAQPAPVNCLRPARWKKEYTFHGKVEKVDTAGKTLMVNGEKVDGWMGAMTMSYSVDKPDALKDIKVEISHG